MSQKHPLGVEKVTTLVPFIFESNPWGQKLAMCLSASVQMLYVVSCLGLLWLEPMHTTKQ